MDFSATVVFGKKMSKKNTIKLEGEGLPQQLESRGYELHQGLEDNGVVGKDVAYTNQKGDNFIVGFKQLSEREMLQIEQDLAAISGSKCRYYLIGSM